MAGTQGNTGATAPSNTFTQILSSLTQGSSTSPMFNPTKTDTTYLTQTSQPDIAAIVNSSMQSLVGRNATPDEIQRYGAELLAAEKQNPGQYTGTTTYGVSGKRNTVTEIGRAHV